MSLRTLGCGCEVHRRARGARRARRSWCGARPSPPRICASLIARASRAYPTGPSASTQQVLALGIGLAVRRGGSIPSVISAPKTVGKTVLAGGEREADRAVEAVVVGDGQAGEPEPRRFDRQLLGVAGAVEEGEIGVAVELGVPGGGPPCP